MHQIRSKQFYTNLQYFALEYRDSYRGPRVNEAHTCGTRETRETSHICDLLRMAPRPPTPPPRKRNRIRDTALYRTVRYGNPNRYTAAHGHGHGDVRVCAQPANRRQERQHKLFVACTSGHHLHGRSDAGAHAARKHRAPGKHPAATTAITQPVLFTPVL